MPSSCPDGAMLNVWKQGIMLLFTESVYFVSNESSPLRRSGIIRANSYLQIPFFKDINLFIYAFIYFWLCWVFVAVRAFSSYFLVVVHRLLFVVASLAVELGL